jgi:predicted transcriptional regulator
MTMLSFRVDDDDARRAQQWAGALGIDRSELLRQALHRHLVRLESEHDAKAWEGEPLTYAETDLARIADWGPAEEWSDWADAAR